MKKLLIKAIKLMLVMALFIVLAASGTFLFFRYNIEDYFASKEERYLYSQLSKMSLSGQKKILLKDATNFEWDYVCIISPYGRNWSKENIEKTVGFKFKGEEAYYRSSSDGEYKFLFISQNTNNSIFLQGYNLLQKNKTMKLCNYKNNTGFLLGKKYQYKKGFYKFNHKFILDFIN
jgi:hypothetical protein